MCRSPSVQRSKDTIGRTSIRSHSWQFYHEQLQFHNLQQFAISVKFPTLIHCQAANWPVWHTNPVWSLSSNTFLSLSISTTTGTVGRSLSYLTLTELCSESHYHLISLFFLEMRAIIERPFLPALGWWGQFATEPYQVTTRNAFFIRTIDDTTIIVWSPRWPGLGWVWFLAVMWSISSVRKHWKSEKCVIQV